MTRETGNYSFIIEWKYIEFIMIFNHTSRRISLSPVPCRFCYLALLPPAFTSAPSIVRVRLAATNRKITKCCVNV